MLGNFYNWINKKSILVEIFGSSWNYEVPEDKEQQLYDFYMLESLLPPGIKLYLKPMDFIPEPNRMGEKDPEGKEYGEPAKSWEDKVYYALYEAVGKLLPQLKANLLKAVLFAITAEVRHVLDAYETNKARKLIAQVGQDLGPEYQKMFTNYIKRKALYSSSEAKTVMRRVPIKDRDLETTNFSRNASYKAMLKSGATNEQWATLALYLFKKAKWEFAFGGEAWANIAEAWIKLNEAKSASHIMSWIDRIYDLQHNTDTVFNKVESYLKGGSYDWLKKALDHKRNIKTPYEIIENVSPAMRKLAQYAMWHLHRVSWQEFQDQKAKYDQEREAERKQEPTHEPLSHEPEREPEDKAEKQLQEYITNKYNGMAYYPKIYMLARLALHMPWLGNDENNINKIIELLKMKSDENLIAYAIEQLKVESTIEAFYDNVGTKIYSHNFKYLYPQEAQQEYDKYFKRSPDVYLIPSDEQRIIDFMKTHSEKQTDFAVELARKVTNYSGSAAKALVYRTFLKAVVEGKLSQVYHQQGHNQKIEQIQQSAYVCWNKNASMPLPLRLARATTSAVYGQPASKEMLATVAEAMGFQIPEGQMDAYYKVYLEEKQKELFFDKSPSYSGTYDRQEAYKIIEQYFKNAPLIKLDPMEEKMLEKMVLNSSQKINSIKLFRESTAWGLKASKNYVEYLRLELAYLGATLS